MTTRDGVLTSMIRLNDDVASTPAAAGFRIGVHDDIAAIVHWPHAGATGDAACHIFQTVEFLRIWQDTYGRATSARPFFVAVYEQDGAPLLMLPLAITRRGGVRELSFIDAAACDYNAPVLFPTSRLWTSGTAAALWADIVAALPPFDILSLVKLPAEVGGLVNPLYLLSRSDNPESCHGTDLAGSWEAVEGTLRNLKTIRKQTRNFGADRAASLFARADGGRAPGSARDDARAKAAAFRGNQGARLRRISRKGRFP